MLFNIKIPQTPEEPSLMNEEEKKFWKSAINRELESVKTHDVWFSVEDKKQQTIDSKWVFKIKDSKNGPVGKARLVTKGFRCYDEVDTYDLVAGITSIRILLAVSVQKRMILKHLDIETAFLNGTLKGRRVRETSNRPSYRKGENFKAEKGDIRTQTGSPKLIFTDR